jgi:hypothetical protein
VKTCDGILETHFFTACHEHDICHVLIHHQQLADFVRLPLANALNHCNNGNSRYGSWQIVANDKNRLKFRAEATILTTTAKGNKFLLIYL